MKIAPLVDLRGIPEAARAFTVYRISDTEPRIAYFNLGLGIHPFDWSNALQRLWSSFYRPDGYARRESEVGE